MSLINCAKWNLLENPVIQWMHSGLGSVAFQFYPLDLFTGEKKQLEIPSFKDYHHLWSKRRQITVVEVECTVKGEGEKKEEGGGRRWPAPLRGTLKIIGLTEGLKVMLHETICNDNFYCNTALQHCCNIVVTRYSIVPTLQWCVALNCRYESSRVTSPLHPSDSSQPLNFVSKFRHGSCTHSSWALAFAYPQQTPVSLCWDIGTHVQYRVQTLFWTRKIQGLFKDFSRAFRDLFPIFQGLHWVQKRTLLFHNMSNFIPKVFLRLLLSLWSST